MHEADVVLAAGVRFDERSMGGKSANKKVSNNSTYITQRKLFSDKSKILHIDIDAAEINKIVQASSFISGDVESTIPLLTIAICKKLNKPCDIMGEKTNSKKTNGQLLISSIANLISQKYSNYKDIYITTDVGLHQMWVAQAYPFEKPKHLLTSGSLGTMGFGLPAAIGVALAHPENRVICISGDSSILMNVQELATLAELGLDVTIIVIDNNSLGMVKQIQGTKYHKRYSASSYKKPSNIALISEGFGVPAIHIDGSKLINYSDGESPEWSDFAFPKTGTGPRLIQCYVPESWT